MKKSELKQSLNSISHLLDVILVPGLRDSVPEHWQSLWHQMCPQWKRIQLRDWSISDLEGWVEAILREQRTCDHPFVLIGHSFGALASYVCTQRETMNPNIAGVVFVALAEPMRFELEESITTTPLRVLSLLLVTAII